MLNYLWHEYKRNIKSTMTLMFVFGLLFVSVVDIGITNEQKKLRNFEGHNYLTTALDFVRLYPSGVSNETKSYRSLAMIDSNIESIIEQHYLDNQRDVIRRLSFNSFLISKKNRYQTDEVANLVYKNRILPHWENVSGGIAFDDVDFRPHSGSGTTYHFYHNGKLYERFYSEHLFPVYTDEVDPVQWLYTYYLSETKMLLIYLVTLIVGVLSVSQDDSSGVLKTLINSGLSRRKYFFGKWLSLTFYCLTIGLIFPIASASWMIVSKGVKYFNYPMLFPDYMWSLFSGGPNGSSPYVPIIGGGYVVGDRIMPQGLHLETLGVYLLWASFLLLLFIGFLTALTMFVSTLQKQGTFAALLVGGIVVIGAGVSRLNQSSVIDAYNPFLAYKPGAYLLGFSSLSIATALVSLFIGTLALLLVGNLLFSKKAI